MIKNVPMGKIDIHENYLSTMDICTCIGIVMEMENNISIHHVDTTEFNPTTLCTIKDAENLLVKSFNKLQQLEPYPGCAIVYQNRRSDGVRSEVGKLSRGSYFGAIALFFNVPNAGTVVAEGHLKCARLNCDRFSSLVKPVLCFLKENADAYKSFDDLIV